MLRLDQIDLDEVARGRAAVAAEGEPHWLLDLLTGHLVREGPDDPVVADPSVRRAWQLVHPAGSGRRAEYRDMSDFVDLLSDGHARESLDRALSGRLPFGNQEEAARRFDDTLRRFPQLQPAWSAFRSARVRRDAVRWLAEMGYVDPAEADAAARAYADPDPPPPALSPRVDADAIARSVAVDLRALYGDRLQQVLLFGSYARGTAHEESDIDLLVVLDSLESAAREMDAMDDIMWRHTLANLVAITSVPISQQDYERAGTPFLARVRSEARVTS